MSRSVSSSKSSGSRRTQRSRPYQNNDLIFYAANHVSRPIRESSQSQGPLKTIVPTSSANYHPLPPQLSQSSHTLRALRPMSVCTAEVHFLRGVQRREEISSWRFQADFRRCSVFLGGVRDERWTGSAGLSS